jgi:IS5 family transposase
MGSGGEAMRQGSFSQAEYAGKKKQTRRDRFLGEMEQVVPWARLVERLRPLYPKGERGRPPIGLERMLRIYFLQQWYGLADEGLEDALYDSQALRCFAGIDLAVESVPDATTLLKFRHWLERHDLTRVLFEEVGAMLEERGLLMRQGTIVDATIIAAASSTKNRSKARDPEMHQTKKGNQWHFGMKAHIGVDVASGWSTRWSAPPPMKPISIRWPPYFTAKKTPSLPTPAIPGRTSGRNTRSVMSPGTSPSGAASSRHCRSA